MILTLLPTKLYFRERTRMIDYINDNEVYRLLYKAFTRVINHPYNFQFGELEAFNNTVLLCTMILHDDDVPSAHYEMYWNYALSLYSWKYAARLTMWMVYGLLSLLDSEADRLGPFLFRIEKHHHRPNDPNDDYTIDYRETIMEFIEQARERHLQLTREDFPLTLLSTEDKWKWEDINWRASTKDFATDNIDAILALWTKKKDKLFVLREIKGGFLADEERIREEQECNDLPF